MSLAAQIIGCLIGAVVVGAIFVFLLWCIGIIKG